MAKPASSADGDEPPPEKKQKLHSIQVTTHEEKLVTALRAHPNRVAMWVGRGDPMKSHKTLLGMYVRFFEICNQYDIEYWLEYGSVLGYVRHGGMIPWEWDMDIGCTPENFRKLKEIGAEIEKTDPVYGFKYYQDPDYKSPAFCFYVKADDNCLCDIAEYLEEGEQLVSEVKDWNYPPHKRSVILPPKRVSLLGQSGLIPARSDVFLAKSETILGQCTGDTDPTTRVLNTIPYMQYDPIPFLLCHMFHPEFAELSCGPPALDIPVAKSIAEGFKEHARAGQPFIVKGAGAGAFKFDFDAFQARAKSEGLKGTARDPKSLAEVKDVSIAGALADLEAKRLAVDFLGTPLPKLVPNSGIGEDLRAVGIDEDGLSLVLSQKNTYLPFHQSPAAGASSGGGWMWLERGKKMLTSVDFGHTDLIFDKAASGLADPPFEDLVYLESYALWGKTWQVYVEAGDFVYFPPGSNVRGWTYGDTVGVGGHVRLDSDAERIASAAKWYEGKGLNPASGLFKVAPPKPKAAEEKKA